MSIQFDHSTVIERSVEDVFEFVTTPENDAQWKPRVVEADPADGEMGVGTTWRQVVKAPLGGTETVDECIEYEPPSRFGYRSASGSIPVEAGYTFAPDGDGTRLTYAGTIEMRGLLWVVQPLLARTIRKDVEVSLAGLNSLLERPMMVREP